MDSGCVGLVHIAVLWERLEQASERYLLLVAKLARKFVRRQIVEERIRHCRAEERLVLVTEARVGEVEPLGVRITSSEVGKIRDISYELLEQIALERNIETVIHGWTEFQRVCHCISTQIGVTAKSFA